MSLVELARFDSRIQADLARLALEFEGIGAVMVDAEVNSFFGAGGLVPVRLMVLDEDHADAVAVLTEDGSRPPG